MMIGLMMMNLMLIMSAYTLHPLIIIVSLILSTTLISYLTYMMTKIALFSYMILLVLLGGLIILFIYMASMAPNEPIQTNNMKIMMSFGVMLTLMISSIKNINWFYNSTGMEIFMLMNNIPLILLVAIYLFITLIAVVQITKITEGPLRSNM